MMGFIEFTLPNKAIGKRGTYQATILLVAYLPVYRGKHLPVE